MRRKAGTEHLLLVMLKETDCVATRLLHTMGINVQKLYSAVLSAMGKKERVFQRNFRQKRQRAPQRLLLTSTAGILLHLQWKANWTL